MDWGIPQDEDRHSTWDDAIQKLDRFVRRTCRLRDVEQIGLLGYCMGATLCGIYLATHPERIAAFANLAGPFDFSEAGLLGEMVNPEWFDVDAVVEAGNVQPVQMQSGFVAMRPTGDAAKIVTYADRMFQPGFKESFAALDEWASDNIAFPAEAYRTYIRELYQENLLVQGRHWVCGRRADLANIECPVLTIAATRDHICPPQAAMCLNAHVGSKVKDEIVVKGGHVGAVVGSKAATTLYPQMTDWFDRQLGSSTGDSRASI
jgi:polyhydroxyalkanoate synthase